MATQADEETSSEAGVVATQAEEETSSEAGAMTTIVTISRKKWPFLLDPPVVCSNKLLKAHLQDSNQCSNSG